MIMWREIAQHIIMMKTVLQEIIIIIDGIFLHFFLTYRPVRVPHMYLIGMF